jgi:hypothetical protein
LAKALLGVYVEGELSKRERGEVVAEVFRDHRTRTGRDGLADIADHSAVRSSSETTEAVRKHGGFLRLAEQTEILRDFFASERPEGSKKRTK